MNIEQLSRIVGSVAFDDKCFLLDRSNLTLMHITVAGGSRFGGEYNDDLVFKEWTEGLIVSLFRFTNPGLQPLHAYSVGLNRIFGSTGCHYDLRPGDMAEVRYGIWGSYCYERELKIRISYWGDNPPDSS